MSKFVPVGYDKKAGPKLPCEALQIDELLNPVRIIFEQASKEEQLLISRQVTRFAAWLDRDTRA